MKNSTINKDEFKDLLDSGTERYVVWDIETGPLPLEELADFIDKKAVKYPTKPGEFDPKTVNYGDTQDIAKRAAKLARVHNKHRVTVENYHDQCEAAEKKALSALYNDAALHSHTNVIVAIGYGIMKEDGSVATFLDFGSERDMVRRVWYMIRRVVETRGQFFTYNGHNFDIPQIVHKAWKYGFKPIPLRDKYRYNDVSVDAAVEWQAGKYRGMVKLDYVAKFLSVGQKLEGVTGDMFHKLLKEGKTDIAEQYLQGDIDCTYRVCEQMGLLDFPKKILSSRSKMKGK